MNKNEGKILDPSPKNSNMNIVIPTNTKESREEKHLHSHQTDSNIANDYTGTTIGKFCSKSSKNFLLLVTVLTIIFIYYFYLHWNIVFIISKSNKGLDYKFWTHKNLEDNQYIKGLIYFTIFHVFFLFFLISFYKAVFTTPGYFSQDYIDIFSLKNKLSGETNYKYTETDEDELNFGSEIFTDSQIEKIFGDSELNNIESKKKREKIFKMMYNMIDHRSALKRICKFCLIIKPERSHHCRVCRKCVLKYDHHCKFLSNCIGFVNYKFFFLFLLYTLILLLFVICTLFEGLEIYINEFGWDTSFCKIFAFSYLFIFLVFVSVADLFIFHLMILIKGITTVENKDKNKRENIYEEKTCKEGMEESFGKGWLCWFCPTKPKLKFGGYLNINTREQDISKSLSRSFTASYSNLNSQPNQNNSFNNSKNFVKFSKSPKNLKN